MTKDQLITLREMTAAQVSGSVMTAADGTKLYTPDGMAKYAALWTRDFGYMLEYAGEMIPLEDQKNALEYLLRNVDVDGWIPDRVDCSGTAFYTAGNGDFAKRNLETARFW